jgi:hypothetical protein
LQQLFRPNFECNRETGQSISTEGNKGNKDWKNFFTRTPTLSRARDSSEFHEFALIGVIRGVIRVKAVFIPEGTFSDCTFCPASRV